MYVEQHPTGLPCIVFEKEDTQLSLIDAYILVGFCKSKNEARRLIQQGGARLNDIVIRDECHMIIDRTNLDNAKE